MQSDLDLQLLLESKYAYIEKLRQAQAEMDVGGTIVLDQLSIARNYVLVNGELFGGAQEKNMPPWTANDETLLTSISLFAASMPIPDVYINKVNYSTLNSNKTGREMNLNRNDQERLFFCLFEEESELHRFVRNSRPDRLDDRWLSKCRHLFMATLRQSPHESLPLTRMSNRFFLLRTK